MIIGVCTQSINAAAGGPTAIRKFYNDKIILVKLYKNTDRDKNLKQS